jgi:hypothetical protein
MWMMHLGFTIFIRVGPFPAVMIMLWWLFVPGVVWDWLGNLWPRLSTHLPSGGTREWPRSRIIAETFCAISLAIVVLWNLWTINPERWRIGPSPTLNAFAHFLRLDQNWSMFAPTAATDDGWMLLDAELYDGTHIDLLRHGQPLTFSKPHRISSEFPDWKWHKFEVNLMADHNAPLRMRFGDFLARDWSRNHPRVRRWTLWFMRKETLPNYQIISPQKVELAKNELFVTK